MGPHPRAELDSPAGSLGGCSSDVSNHSWVWDLCYGLSVGAATLGVTISLGGATTALSSGSVLLL